MPDEQKRPLGGFLELELRRGGAHLHPRAERVNTGRNALELILRRRPSCRRVLLPSYICPSALEPAKRLGLDFAFYGIGSSLEPTPGLETQEGDAVVFVNYFGLLDSASARSALACRGQAIIDASQAFYFEPPSGTAAFYSPRKFFGVPDGAYATDPASDGGDKLEPDSSWERCGHLMRRIDEGPEDAYRGFLENEKLLGSLPVRSMSRLTEALLTSIDYADVASRRRWNYLALDTLLGGLNELKLKLESSAVPLAYPFLPRVGGEELKARLIAAKVFCPTYWPSLAGEVGEGSFERRLSRELACLPVDQRYGETDMRRVAELVVSFAKL